MRADPHALAEAGLEMLISGDRIRARISELASQIDADYRGKELLMVAVLRGAVIFLSDLMRAVSVDAHVDFMAVSSYGDSTVSSGVVRIIKDLDEDIGGRHTLLVEDVIDSGLTLDYLVRQLKERAPASLEVCTLLDKRSARKSFANARYVGFEVGEEFLVGYGLDIAGGFRGLDAICRLASDTPGDASR